MLSLTSPWTAYRDFYEARLGSEDFSVGLVVGHEEVGPDRAVEWYCVCSLVSACCGKRLYFKDSKSFPTDSSGTPTCGDCGKKNCELVGVQTLAFPFDENCLPSVSYLEDWLDHLGTPPLAATLIAADARYEIYEVAMDQIEAMRAKSGVQR